MISFDGERTKCLSNEFLSFRNVESGVQHKGERLILLATSGDLSEFGSPYDGSHNLELGKAGSTEALMQE